MPKIDLLVEHALVDNANDRWDVIEDGAVAV
jgi:hypothetical protein